MNLIPVSFLFMYAVIGELTLVLSKQSIYKKVIFDDHNECLCSNQQVHLKTIPELLDPENKGIERLVIFLYRTETGKIYTYIPKKSTQSLLPDLQNENGDTLIDNSNEQLNTVFLNSNKTIKYGPSVHNFTPSKKIYLEPNKKSYVNELEMLKTNFSGEIRPTAALHGELANQNKHFLSPHFSKNHTLRPNHEYGLQLLPKENFDKSSSNETFNQWFKNEMKNVEKKHSIKHPINYGTLVELLQTALRKRSMLVSSKGILTDLNGNPLMNMSNLQLTPIIVGDTLEYDEIKSNPNDAYTLPQNSSYVQSIIIGVLKPPHTIGVIPLAKTISTQVSDCNQIPEEENEQENTDVSNENDSEIIIKAKNLEKNAVQVQNKNMNVENVTNNNDNDENKTMTSKVNQLPKIGAIKEMTGIENPVDRSEVNNNSRPEKQHDFLAKITKNVNPTSMESVGLIRKILLKLLSGKSINKDNNNNLPGFSSRLQNDLEDLENSSNDHTKSIGEDRIGRSKPQKYMKVVQSSSNDKKKSFKEDSIGPSRPQKYRVKDVQTSNDDTDSIDEENISPLRPQKDLKDVQSSSSSDDTESTDEDPPDFRIIGGNAATGSGVPISNRGRSGLIDMILYGNNYLSAKH